MINWMPTRRCVVAALLCLVACSAQVDPEYRGKPLGVLQGQVLSKEGAVSSAGEAALLFWGGAKIPPESQVASSRRLLSLGVRAPVSGEFPSRFQMKLFTPPPPEAFDVPTRWSDSDRGFLGWVPSLTAIALIVALAPGTDKSHVTPKDILGVSTDHVVVFLARDIGAEPPLDRKTVEDVSLSLAHYTAREHAIPGTKGFHLARLNPITATEQKEYWSPGPNGVCARLAPIGEPVEADADEVFSSVANFDYEQCLRFSDGSAKTCTLYILDEGGELTHEQSAETDRCWEMLEAWDATLPLASGEASPQAVFIPNEAGFADPVTITLGATVRDYFEASLGH
jgi:hypothetical protein